MRANRIEAQQLSKQQQECGIQVYRYTDSHDGIQVYRVYRCILNTGIQGIQTPEVYRQYTEYTEYTDGIQVYSSQDDGVENTRYTGIQRSLCMSLHSWGGAPIIRGAQGWQTPLAMEQMMIESSIVPCAHIDASSSVRISSHFD